MKTNYITNQIETANMKYQAAIERAEQKYKEEMTKAAHDLLERNKAYYPDGLRIWGNEAFAHPYLEIWNEDGKKIQRTFVAESNGYQYKPCTTCKMQEDSVEAVKHIIACIVSITEEIEKFEQVDGGTMFQFAGLHFKGTHTLHDLGLDTMPEYIITEMVGFGFPPNELNTKGYTGHDRRATHSQWNRETFLTAAPAGEDYDIFLCMENGQYYYPAADKLANIYMEHLQDNIASWLKNHECKAA